MNPDTLNKEIPTVNWEQLIALEPRFSAMLDRARSIRDDGEWFCANRVWREQFREEFNALVHNCSKRISVPSWKIHDVVRREIFFEGLPDCRACVCTAFWELEIAPRLAEVKAERQP